MYVVLSLALNQTRFFHYVFGAHAVYIVFDSDSVKFLKKNGCTYKVVNIRELKEATGEQAFGDQIKHEMLNFKNRDLLRLTSTYYNVINCLDELDFRPRLVLQEFGGYVANRALYDWTLSQSEVDHFFIEPSFFRGQLFFLRNSYSFDGLIVNKLGVCFDYFNIPDFNIPIKDKKHYSEPIFKILSFYSAQRLALKLYGVFRGKFYYFDDILGHVSKHLLELRNALLLRRYYINVSDIKGVDAVFVPLHVPGDAALTIREPAYLDQLAFIRNLLTSNPEKMFYIKEHPARIGSISAISIIKLLTDYSNVRILNPLINVREVSAVVKYCAVINSKAGAEFLFNGCGAFVFGNVYYKNFRNARFAESGRLEYFELSTDYLPDFHELSSKSFTGELYVADPLNLDHFRKIISTL